MDSLNFPYRLYLVTDEMACLGRDFFWVIEEAIKGGVDLVQLREKDLSQKAFLEKAKRALDLCSRYEVPMIINDEVIVASESKAFGLHLGQADENLSVAKMLLGQEYPIGLSLELLTQLADKVVNEAWYLGVSPIYPTMTKPDTLSAWGLEGLEELRIMTDKPLVAIGGIKLENAYDILNAGADCLAVVSGICSAKSPGRAAAQYYEIIDKAKN
ncbi:MAG: thiamine phosphate synthase [Cyclobacteriaceae bacterium]